VTRHSGERELRIGTRGSRLALIQANYVKEKIEGGNPGVRVTLKTITTTADRVQSSPLHRIGGKGLFLKEIEEALAAGLIDLAVHSMKDVPMEMAEVFEIAAITEREDPRDALVLKDRPSSLMELPEAARVATGSFRRGSQLLHVRPDIRIVPIRGNQDTRIRKMKEQNLDAVVLAMAGIRRMGFKDIHVHPLDPDICLPAGGQGSIGVEIRRNDEEARNLIGPLNDPGASVCIRAERACLRGLGAECYTPVAAFAEIVDSKIHLKAIVAEPGGQRVLKEEKEGGLTDPESLGMELADHLLSRGAEEIIRSLKGSF
jgi:hydroxymethylbilane synthase